ncbi:MAG: hypothetical protein CMK00_08425 [Planctomycetes bacterium]|jgi:hypothetical protein|nr:hypothetical protein [Planctomycetota bacterium]HJO26951.1 hypothetical protein [Planctomycetota bacterium]
MITSRYCAPLALCVLTSAAAHQDASPPGESWDQEQLERISLEIRAELEGYRGRAGSGPVAVELTDGPGFLAYAQRRLEAMETPEDIQAWQDTCVMLGLIPADMDLMEVTLKVMEGQVGGFYDPGQDTFYLMEGYTGGVAKIIIAHELTHALDDQWFDIDGTLKSLGGNSDAELAYQAVVEGSGVAAMNRWTMEHIAELNLADIAAAQAGSQEAMAAAPPVIWKPLLAVYLRGEAFLRRTSSVMNMTMASAKAADVERVFASVPSSSEQILHPEKYWDAEQRDEPLPVHVSVGELPEGWRVMTEDTLGELSLALVLEPFDKRRGLRMDNPMGILGISYTGPATEGWGGDRMVLLAKGAARVLFLATEWDRPQDAAEFHAALAGLRPELETRLGEAAGEGGSGLHLRRGREGAHVRLVTWIGTTEDEVDAVLGAIEVSVQPASAPAVPGITGDK